MNDQGFSPEVLELLQESLLPVDAGRPRIPLLNVAPSGRALEGTPIVTDLEQFLVERYREEVAKLLYLASRRLLTAVPTVVSRIHWSEGRTTQDWEDRRLRAVARSPRVAGLSEELLLLRAYRRARVRVSPGILARASFALRPHEHTRILLAIALKGEKRAEEARALLDEALAFVPSALDRALASTVMGSLLFELGEFATSVEAYRDACLWGEPRPLSAVNWFTGSLLVADRRGALRAARLLDEWVPRAHTEVEECKQILRHGIRQGWWRLPREGATLLRSIRDRLPTVASEVADVVASAG